MSKIFNRATRKWIYAIALASFPILAYFGVIELSAAPVFLPFILALLNLTPADVERDEAHYDIPEG